MGKRLHPSLATIFEPSSLISNLRGVGTFIAFDFVTPQIRDDFVGRMKAEGVLIGGCGDKTVRSFWLPLAPSPSRFRIISGWNLTTPSPHFDYPPSRSV